MAEAKTKKELSEIRIHESIFSYDSGVLDYLDYTKDLMSALVAGLTEEKSVCHTLGILIERRLEELESAIKAAY